MAAGQVAPTDVGRVARLVLPHNAVVALAARDADETRAIDVRRAIHFRGRAPDGGALSPPALLAEIEALKEQGVQFFILPSASSKWLEEYEWLRSHFESHYRVVVQEDETCLIVALFEADGALQPGHAAPDGLPLPPPEMIQLTAGLFKGGRVYERFFEGGVRMAETIESILHRNGIEMNGFDALLEFGSGCGRVIRHWKTLRGPSLAGTDYNPYLVEWCRKHLPHADFHLNESAPRLAFDDGRFDFVYAISVFTHLAEDLQKPWLNELRRIVRPGGLVFVTLKGASHFHDIQPVHQQRFLDGELVVRSRREFSSGSNSCVAYHPERYVREVFAGDELEILDYLPDAALNQQQDVVLLRK
jgi:SAM-dependent methyltransferase